MNEHKEVDFASLALPEVFEHLAGVRLFESSGESGARTVFARTGKGAYLKIAAPGSLKKAAVMQTYFHSKGLSSKMLAYHSLDRDYLLTEALKGKDGTTNRFLSQPERLARFFGESLRLLHNMDAQDCPVKNCMAEISAGFETARFDQPHLDLLRDFIGPADAKKVGGEAAEKRGLLKNDTLIHGDYCLPNIMVWNWRLMGFIDVAGGGLGDAHYDLVWGLWTLAYNLRTPAFGRAFLEAYGAPIDKDRLRAAGILAAME